MYKYFWLPNMVKQRCRTSKNIQTTGLRGFIRFANVQVFLITKYGTINGAELQKNTQTTGPKNR